jgi:hypothetical protein
MAKVQNTFIKSKMNKDLDDRILSKGEYRDAQNINVSKSEGSDVGAMENVLGNKILNNFAVENLAQVDGAVIIGSFMDYTNERIFVFITNYTDVNGNTVNVNYAPSGAYCSIAVYDLNNNQSSNLVKGNFLNFSTTNPILDINLIEDLLFFTDDRNQPRKINVNLALSANADSNSPHYFNEDQISLAKYYPYKTPILFDNITVLNFDASNADATIGGGAAKNDGGSSNGDISIKVNTTNGNIFAGMAISGGNIPSNTTIISYDGSTIVLSSALTGADATGTNYTITWKLTSSASLIKAGMYLVLDSSVQTQSQNIQISYIVNDTTVNLSSTVASTFSSQTVKIYYPTSYTKNKKYLTPSMAGHIASSTGVIPYPQQLNNTFDAYFNGVPRVGMLISCNVGGSTASGLDGVLADDTLVSAVATSPAPFTGAYRITTSKTFNKDDLRPFNKILLSDPNPYYDLNWPGDPDYLEEKFVRFSYRFKYEDGEYSLIAPFTQPCFIPKQDGYLTTGLGNKRVVRKKDAGDSDYQNGDKRYDIFQFSDFASQEEAIGTSTIVSFFENRVQEVDIQVPCDYVINQLYSELKVIEIDILYKESDGLQVKVLDTFANTDEIISSNSTNLLTYNYQSRKPFRNLTDAEVVRVYDKVPVRAKTQSVTGNRVVFGNFYDKPTPPLTLNYAVSVSEKFRIDSTNGTNNGFSNISAALAYPNHSVKQNRTYQVGVVLQDKYGRSSDVVLSSLGDETIQFPAGSGGAIFSGSTIFHNYRLSSENIYNWFGDSIKMLWQNPIPETVSYASGYPGLYRSGLVKATVNQGASNNIFTLVTWDNNIIVGSIVKGADSQGNSFSVSIIALDSVANPKTITLSKDVVISANTAIEIIGNANPLGWYSYKIVVKASEEDYYNAYLPNALAGSTQYSIGAASNLSHITLLADNINKIPSDVTSATPEQTQFRTSDEVLFPRVAQQNWTNQTRQINVSAGENITRSKFFTVESIGKVSDLGINTNSGVGADGAAIKAAGIFDASSNPTVAKLNTYGTTFGGFFNNPANNPVFVPDLTGADWASTGVNFYQVDVTFGNAQSGSSGTNRGVPLQGNLYPKPDIEWVNESASGFVGKISGASSSGWGYWSNNSSVSPAANSVGTTTDGAGTGMRVRLMSVGPDANGGFSSPYEYAAPSTLYVRVQVRGTGYKAGDTITIPASTSGTGTSWTDPLKFKLQEAHLATPESSEAVAGQPISVIEIKPATSNLDIYWETSTSGLIRDLNDTINSAAALSAPTELLFTQLGIGKGAVNFPETVQPFTFISQFTCLNGVNGALGNVVFNLDKVENAAGTIVSGDFGLTNNPTGTGNIYNNNASFFQNNNNLNTFTFFVTATNISLGISYSNTFNFTGSIINATPTIVRLDGSAITSSDLSASSQGSFIEITLYARNGAYDTVADQQNSWNLGAEPSGGTWSLREGVGGTSTATVGGASGLMLSRQRIRFVPPGYSGTFTNTISVTDGSGNGLTSTVRTMTVVVAYPSGNNPGG